MENESSGFRFWEFLQKIAKNTSNHIGWLMVLGATLTMSDYSLFHIARYWGTPPLFAVLAGVIFDGAAILFADYSLKHARVGSSGFGPQMGVIICAGLSAYINSEHAVINGQPFIARIFWAAPPLVSVAAYEFHIKWERRRALANAGRIPPDLPAYGRWAWILFPIKTLRISRTIVRYRLGITLARATPGMAHTTPPVPVPGSADFSPGSGVSAGTLANIAGSSVNIGGTTSDLRELEPGSLASIREWARSQGRPVNRRGPIPNDVIAGYMRFMSAPAIEAPAPEPPADIVEESSETIPDNGGSNKIGTTIPELGEFTITAVSKEERKVNGHG
jgi:Protein of unknown function (DUF2637)